MPRAAVLLALLCGCDTTIDWAVQGEADYGQVFVCGECEFCWDGEADELAALVGESCREIRFDDRFWPWLVGCAYSCDGSLTGPGANATCGTACR